MTPIYFIVFVISLICIFVECDDNSVKVRIPNGEIIGEFRNYYYAFEGIPYAEPPIGENRLEAPKALTEQWTEPRKVTYPGDMCIQYNHFIFSSDKIQGNEDCLFLNIYTRNTNPDVKYPVLFFIHGGAFTFGHGDFYGPRILLHRDLILVTFNYRLGPLGFLSTLDSELPGNLGLKDQNFALMWVNENIEQFGGDSNKITIIGYSAGGSSVHLHYMSQLSRGLFQNGISHSGSALNPWAMTKKADEKARKVGLILDCPVNSTQELKKCLKSKPAEDIVRTVGKFQPWLYNPFAVFGPVVEIPSDSAFISKSPIQYIQNGEISPQPWIASFCKDEGIYPAGEFMREPEYLSQLDEHWSDYLPFILHYNDSIAAENLKNISKKIRKYYLRDNPLTEQNFPILINLISDGLYKNGIQHAIELQSQTTTTPLYFYFYQYAASYGLETSLSKSLKDWGVSHGDDVLTLFESVMRRDPFGLPYEEREFQIQEELVELYESFLNNKIPTFGGTELEPVTINEDGFSYLDIVGPTDHHVKRTKDLANKDFWDNVLPIV